MLTLFKHAYSTRLKSSKHAKMSAYISTNIDPAHQQRIIIKSFVTAGHRHHPDNHLGSPQLPDLPTPGANVIKPSSCHPRQNRLECLLLQLALNLLAARA